VQGRASEQLRAHQQLLLVGRWRENTREAGAMFLQLGQIYPHLRSRIMWVKFFFPLGQLMLSLPPLLCFCTLICRGHRTSPDGTRANVALTVSPGLPGPAHTGPDPAKHPFSFKPVKRFISFNRTIKRFKVKYTRNCFPESNPK